MGLPVDARTPDARQVTKLAGELREPAVGSRVKHARPAKSTRTQPKPAPVVHLTLDGGVRIPGAELSPALYATLKHAASTYNPDFYDRQRRRQSTWNVPRIICSYDETLDDHLLLPRGLLGTATNLIEQPAARSRPTTGEALAVPRSSASPSISNHANSPRWTRSFAMMSACWWRHLARARR